MFNFNISIQNDQESLARIVGWWGHRNLRADWKNPFLELIFHDRNAFSCVTGT